MTLNLVVYMGMPHDVVGIDTKEALILAMGTIQCGRARLNLTMDGPIIVTFNFSYSWDLTRRAQKILEYILF